MPTDSNVKKKTSLAKHLWERRVLQILCFYLGGCWAIIEFVSSLLVDRFMLSSHLITFSLTILLSLIPSVLLIAYFHGKPGKDQWTKVEKIGIPLNLIVTALIVISIFSGKDLGATTTSIIVEDEAGKKIERSIPKGEFRKRVAIFYFENESGDSAIDWLQYATMIGCYLDLLQDPIIC